jgi:hypothetical protein
MPGQSDDNFDHRLKPGFVLFVVLEARIITGKTIVLVAKLAAVLNGGNEPASRLVIHDPAGLPHSRGKALESAA